MVPLFPIFCSQSEDRKSFQEKKQKKYKSGRLFLPRLCFYGNTNQNDSNKILWKDNFRAVSASTWSTIIWSTAHYLDLIAFVKQNTDMESWKISSRTLVRISLCFYFINLFLRNLSPNTWSCRFIQTTNINGRMEKWNHNINNSTDGWSCLFWPQVKLEMDWGGDIKKKHRATSSFCSPRLSITRCHPWSLPGDRGLVLQ